MRKIGLDSLKKKKKKSVYQILQRGFLCIKDANILFLFGFNQAGDREGWVIGVNQNMHENPVL